MKHFHLSATRSRAHATEARSPLDLAVREAIESSLRTLQAEYGSLPTPVRLRACGAVAAWETARRAAGPAGRELEALLRDPAVPPLSLLERQAEFIDRHTSFDFSAAPMGNILRTHAINTIYRQTFWARHGALYEPTPALHRLLEASDVAQDVPLSLIRVPAPALCIVPVPEVRDARDGFQAMLIFEHVQPTPMGGAARCLTFILQMAGGDDALVFAPQDDGQTVVDAFHHPLQRVSLRTHQPDPDLAVAYQRWKRPLDYAMKVLLYLAVHEGEVLEERAYSMAPRTFAGLGKRKREERQAQIERLYDRYVVGPAVLPESSRSLSTGETSAEEVSPHWRRGHFRLQPYGPRASLRKVMFISPTVVRADKLTAIQA